jgi:hypothetical protein
MKRGTFLGLALVLSSFAIGFYVARLQPKTVYANSKCVIPQSYGACRGSIGPELLIFEDAAGTVRLVHPASGQVFGTVIRK